MAFSDETLSQGGVDCRRTPWVVSAKLDHLGTPLKGAGQTVCKWALFAGVIAQLDAKMVADWRFEEATSGEVPASAIGGAVPNTLLDSSGNGNHMQTWTTATAPGYSVQLAPPAGTLAVVAGAFELAKNPESELAVRVTALKRRGGFLVKGK